MNKYTLGYQRSVLGNVGDDLNTWLLPRLLPDIVFGKTNKVILGIGSILVADRWESFEQKVVLGSGGKSLQRMPRLDYSWDVKFVRGPKTASAMGVKSISDPALLISRYVPRPTGGKGIGIVPYYRSSHRIWQAVAAQTGAKLISPHLDVEAFISAIGTCERVFCEAMHGAIFADALRVPWRPVTFQNIAFEGNTHSFKWSDWTGSVNLKFDPLVQPWAGDADWSALGKLAKLRLGISGLQVSRKLAYKLRSAIQADEFILSAVDVFEDRVEEMAQVFHLVNIGK